MLLKPFKAELTSVLNGTRLMRALLEVISSSVINTFHQLNIFIKNTLLFILTEKKSCNLCDKWFDENENLFAAEPKELEVVVEKISTQFNVLHFTG